MNRLILLVSLTTLGIAGIAAGQDCGVWLPGPNPPDFPPGLLPLQFVTGNGEIYARVRDNGRPGLPVDVWRFDGKAWNMLSWDHSAMGEPDAIAFENNQLAVASRKLNLLPNANRQFEVSVRTWDGSSWVEFGTFTSEEYSAACSVSIGLFDICFLSNSWYVAGEIGGGCGPEDPVYKITLGGSIQVGATATSQARNQLECYGGAVYLGGSFTSVSNPDTNVAITASNIARLSGNQWQTVTGGLIGEGVNGEIVNMAIWQDDLSNPFSVRLVVAGKFNQAGSTSANGIVAYSGFFNTWNALGSGVSWPPDLPFGASWRGPAPLVAFPAGGNDVDLLVEGMLSAGGSSFPGFARWNGSGWSAFDVGLNSVPNTAVVYQGHLVAAGGFSGESVAGGELLFGVGWYDGAHWQTLSRDGTDAIVRALLVHNGVVYAGGDFTTMDGTLSDHVAALVSDVWTPMGSGISGPVYSLAAFAGEIVAGGTFSHAGDVAAQNIAAWNGTSWRALGTGLDGTVEGLAVWNNQLVAVGAFETDDGQSTSLPGVAVWNGLAWVPLHEDVVTNEAHAVAVHNGQLYLGGGFNGGIARFTGTQLEIVGGGVVGGSVYALTSLSGSLYVGGDFVGVGANQFIPGVARWTGSQWLALNNNGNFANFSGVVLTLSKTAGELFVGGQFEVNTGQGPMTRHMAAWNGVVWRALYDSHLDGRVHASAPDAQTLWAGGEFLRTANGVVSAYIARWSPDPAFITHPLSKDVCADDGTKTVEFSASIVPDSGTTVRWLKNNAVVSDNLRISGAMTPTLSIFGVLPEDAGDYRLRATDECGNTTLSEIATLTFDGCCPGDMNNDSAVNLSDAKLFVNCLAGPDVDPSCPNVSRADLDDDLDVDLGDAAYWQRTFAGACD